MRAIRRGLVVALGVLVTVATPGRAGSLVITPDSLAVLPTLTTPASHGVAVPNGGYVDQQYSGLGPWFAGAAVSEINGVRVWTPVAYPDGGPSLNFAAGASIHVGFVDPVSQDPATVGTISAEFIGVPAGRALMTVYDGSGSTNLIDADIGPHGGGLIAFQGAGVFGVSLSRAFAGQKDLDTATEQPWGIAEIQIGELTVYPPVDEPPPVEDPPIIVNLGGDQQPVSAPEPGTAMLALCGGLAALGLFRRRS
jgi:hypothetical protein